MAIATGLKNSVLLTPAGMHPAADTVSSALQRSGAKRENSNAPLAADADLVSQSLPLTREELLWRVPELVSQLPRLASSDHPYFPEVTLAVRRLVPTLTNLMPDMKPFFIRRVLWALHDLRVTAELPLHRPGCYTQCPPHTLHEGGPPVGADLPQLYLAAAERLLQQACLSALDASSVTLSFASAKQVHQPLFDAAAKVGSCKCRVKSELELAQALHLLTQATAHIMVTTGCLLQIALERKAQLSKSDICDLVLAFGMHHNNVSMRALHSMSDQLRQDASSSLNAAALPSWLEGSSNVAALTAGAAVDAASGTDPASAALGSPIQRRCMPGLVVIAQHPIHQPSAELRELTSVLADAAMNKLPDFSPSQLAALAAGFSMLNTR